MRRLLATVYVLAFVLVIAACGNQPAKLQKGLEMGSYTAPDGQSRAFIWKPEGSSAFAATNSQSYQVWLQYSKSDTQPSLVLEADETDGVFVVWRGPSELEICYGPAHIYRYDNFFDRADQQSQLYRVEILLRHVSSLSDCK
jgi:hypothetical protein